ncbi:MAG: hypothetical protein L6R40_006636 [Gallowayella cf. fulva]|nr:MAG: hypothetical protein L6R40_006636 [Xanthomendoza cf. fulva]
MGNASRKRTFLSIIDAFSELWRELTVGESHVAKVPVSIAEQEKCAAMVLRPVLNVL